MIEYGYGRSCIYARLWVWSKCGRCCSSARTAWMRLRTWRGSHNRGGCQLRGLGRAHQAIYKFTGEEQQQEHDNGQQRNNSCPGKTETRFA